jgi:hypothetical protein
VRSALGNILLSLGIIILIFTVVIGETTLWSIEGFHLIYSRTFGFAAGISLTALGAFLSFPCPPPLLIPILGLPLVLFSNWLIFSYNFFQGPSIRGEIIVGAFFSLFLITKKPSLFWRFLLLAAAAGIALSFLFESRGRIIFSDDLSVFFYRLELLKRHFPHIPFYNPLWNAGIDARDFFASGSLNFFLLFAPVICFFDLASSYNILIGLLIFVIAPLAAYVSAKYARLSCLAASFAGILMLSLGLPWYRWALKYGTLGFITSASVMLLAVVLATRLFDEDRKQFGTLELLLLVVTSSLVTFWSLSVVALLPVALIGAWYLRNRFKEKIILTFIVCMLIVHALWVPIFITASKVGSFVKAEATHEEPFRHNDRIPTVKQVLKNLSEAAISTNPLLIFLTIPGLWSLSISKRRRLTFAATLAWLGVLGSVAVTLKPQLELDRMLVVASVLAVIPAAAALEMLYQLAAKSGAGRAAAAIPFGFFLLSPFVSASVVRNRSSEQYHFASPLVDELGKAISNFGGDGRVVFSGFVLHELSGGHLAPLIFSSSHPLIASSFVHNRWSYQQIIPKEFLEKDDAGIKEYLDLVNASSVIAHERSWREYFLNHPADYTQVWAAVPFMMFKRNSPAPGYFLEGSGTVNSQSTNSVKFTLDKPDAVLKFNYFPFIAVEGCDVAPENVSESLAFIRVSNCPTGKELTLESRGAWWRIFHKF